MDTVTIYNYSGTNQPVGSQFVIPPGGPYVFERDSAEDASAILIDVSGDWVEADIVPDYFSDFTTGFGFGLALAGAMLTLWILRLLRKPVVEA